MKKTKLLMTLAPLLALLAFTAPAADKPQEHIATIDMEKVFEKYYKYGQAMKVIEKNKNDLESGLKSIDDDYKKAADEYAALKDKASANDPMISAEERERQKQKVQQKYDELLHIQNSMRTAQATAQAQLANDQERVTEALVEDIRTAVNAKAKSAGYTLVIDTTSRRGVTPVVLFSNGQSDITDEIIKQLNAAAPTLPMEMPRSDDKTPAKTAEGKSK